MPAIGDPAINFSGEDVVNTGTINLSDYYGNVIWITFVAHW
jgi:hypothetical protein